MNETIHYSCLGFNFEIGSSKKSDNLTNGVPVLRMGNVSYDGFLDCEDLKYADFSDGELEKYLLLEGDLLFNRTNSKELVGKTGIWDGRFKAVAASYFICLRIDKEIACPVYVWGFMNSSAVKLRLFTMARGAIGQSNINLRELGLLSLPTPPLEQQRRYEQIIGTVQRAVKFADSSSTISSILNTSLANQLL